MTLSSRSAFGLGAASVLALAVAGAMPAAAEWKPIKPVEFVVMAGQGGGADKLARFIQSIIEKNKFAEVPFIPINKGGGSGADALRYLKDNKGNDHVIMATLNSYYTTPLRNPGIGVNIEEFTPIARLAEDTFVLWVNADSPVKSVDDYVKTVKEKGAGWKMGGTGTGQEDSLVTALIERAYGLKMTYVPFKGGGDVAVNLVGKHVDSTVNNPSEAIGFQQAGKVRPLASLTMERIPEFKDVPTFKELGKDLVYRMQRSVVAPGGIKPEVVAYYKGVFDKVFNSSEWKGYCTKNALQCSWLAGDDLKNYFKEETAKHQALLKEMGEIK
ncbi:MAG TPA: tripartite tricarboxylate transporter substrate-binding protein [Hyphomicrobiaceae bacterium]|nr:tripartite tricarboxylate transporter substrate-binding protein [Hyphomicrobiaceae bacterium]